MAHYAFLDENNIVTEVIVGKDEDDLETLPNNYNSWEEYYLSRNTNKNNCKRTSYNTINNQHLNNETPFRGNYAGIGFTYDEINDVFIPPKPFDSWLIDENIWNWKAPIDYPDDGEVYIWNEETQSWDLKE